MKSDCLVGCAQYGLNGGRRWNAGNAVVHKSILDADVNLFNKPHIMAEVARNCANCPTWRRQIPGFKVAAETQGGAFAVHELDAFGRRLLSRFGFLRRQSGESSSGKPS